MKAILLVLFLPLGKMTFGQSAFYIKFSTDVCDCLDSSKANNVFTKENLIYCFQKAMKADSELIMQESKKIYGDTSSKNAYKFGKELAEQMAVSLVKDCKIYFISVDSLRYRDYKNLNQDSLKLQLKILNDTARSKMSEEFYSLRMGLYFQLKMYDSSLNDIESVLKIDPGNFKILFIKAWIYEIKGNYDEAISIYDKVAELTHSKNFYIFSEIAKRKKTGL